MEFCETGQNRFNVNHVRDFRYDLDEITKELSLGDIYNVRITIYMVNGGEFLLDGFDEMYEFIRMTNSGSSQAGIPGKKSIGYYLQKSKEYHDVKQGNETK